MKRVISLVTVLSLAFSMFAMPAMSYAEEVNGSITPVANLVGPSAADGITDAAGTSSLLPLNQGAMRIDSNALASEDEGLTAVGGIVDISLSTQISPQQGANLRACIEHVGTGQYDSYTLDPVPLVMKDTAGAVDEYYARIKDIDSGKQKLHIYGTGYQDFYQDVVIADGDRIVVTLIDTTINESVYMEHMGMGLIPYGDFDGDGSITSDDSKYIAAAVNRNVGVDPDDLSAVDFAKYNLDGSEGIGINDVQIMAMNIGKHKFADTRTTKDPSFIKTDATKINLIGDSSVSDLFIDNGAITTLAPEVTTKDISTTNPVEFQVTPAANTEMAGMVISVPQESDGRPTQGEIIVETDQGNLSIPFTESNVTTRNVVRYAARMSLRAAAVDQAATNSTYDPNNGIITIDFGNQIAVKKITIRITNTVSNKLAEIAQVEFLNGMEDKIPEPQLDIPQNLAAVPGDAQFDLTWKPCVNITGYQVEISCGTSKTTTTLTGTSLSVDKLGGKKLKNDTEYSVRVRSMSESDGWFSPWCNPVTVTPVATKAPKTPDSVTLRANFNDIAVSWKAAEDAKTYNVYWSEDERNWEVTRGITSTSYTIQGLRQNIGYYVQVSASNDIGESGKSKMAYCVTQTANIKVPWYNLINRTCQANVTGEEFDDGIMSVTKGAVGNNNDKNPNFKSFWDVVDGDYSTYWYNGASGSGGPQNGPVIEFDEEHEMDHLIMTTFLGSGFSTFASIRVYVWDADGNGKHYWGPYESSIVTYSSVKGASNTIRVKFPKSKVKKIQVTGQRYYSAGDSTIAELAFYDYDDFADKIADIWEDSLHTTLKGYVNQQTLDDLRAELETPDPLCGELSPNYSYYDLELKNAQTVFDHGDLRPAVYINSSVDKSVNNYVGGTNAWQPVGVSVKSGDTINVYVGASDVTNGVSGTATALAMYVGQQHPLYSKPVFTLFSSLKTGLNSITVPEGYSQEAESGGALYVEYISSNKGRGYNVRIEGGTKIPILDVHGVTDEAKRLDLATKYVTELEEHVNGLEAYHNDNHTDTMDGAYNSGKNCVANMTDVAIDYLMYSVPASLVWSAVKISNEATPQQRAQKLLQSLANADKLMVLFYQHKGLSDFANASGDTTDYGKNGLPKSRQNIRYTQMFSGAFMYASGNHIGIQWGSVTGLFLEGVTADANGRYVSGKNFGWGVNHEIGHEINQGAYAIAEVTNNYYAQLGQSKDSTASARWGSYEKVYKKVTSGSKGMDGGKVGIAMYWQLHLAYDGMSKLAATGEKSYNYKTYDNYTDVFNNLFFARVDSYARNTAKAPAPGGVGLTLNTNKDNAIIRLASAAAQKDLRDYFIAYGLTPDTGTDNYCSQFEKETRGIQYVTDETRLYQMDNYSAAAAASIPAAPSSLSLDYTYGSNAVRIDLSGCYTGDDVLGYEILRNGKPVGFVQPGTTSFTDRISTINNRVFTYQVQIVNKWLNRSEPSVARSVKVHHDNILDKSDWTLKTDLRDISDPNDGAFTEEEIEESLDWVSTSKTENSNTATACNGTADNTKLAANRAIDGNTSTVFTGTNPEGVTGNPSITIDFGGALEMTAVRYYTGGSANAITNYQIAISNDGENFETIRTGAFDTDNGVATVFFDEGGKENRLLIYDASYMRITATNQSTISIADIDVLGPTGDDVDLIANGIGTLVEDTVVGTNSAGDPEVIPAGSFIVTGTYQGNPAYNVVVLYDNDKLRFDSARPQVDAIIEGSQIVFGEQPVGDEMLPDVRVGYWAYYVTPADMQEYKERTGEDWTYPRNVSAELYRVDDALTLEGQRQVANTLGVEVPDPLNDIRLSFGSVNTASLLNDFGLDEIVDPNIDFDKNVPEDDPSDDSGDDQQEAVLPDDNPAILRDDDPDDPGADGGDDA